MAQTAPACAAPPCQVGTLLAHTSPALLDTFLCFISRLPACHVPVPMPLSSSNWNECHPPGMVFKWNKYSPLFRNSKREREGSHGKPKIQITENQPHLNKAMIRQAFQDSSTTIMTEGITLAGLRKSTLQRSKRLHLFYLPKSSTVCFQVKIEASGNIPLRQPECGYSRAFRII